MGEVSNGSGNSQAGTTNTGQEQATQQDPKNIAGASAGAAAQKPGQTSGDPIKDAAQAAIRKHKLKVDGQEIEIDEEELKRGYAHQKSANKKLQEGLKYRKQSEDFVKAMKNPETLVDTLFKMGYDRKQVRDLSEKFLAGELEEELLDPKDRELKTTKQRLQEFEKKEADRKAHEEKEHNDRLKAKYAKDFETEFMEALQSTGLPPTKDMVAEMARYISRAAKIKMPMSATEAAKLVQEDLQFKNKHLFSNIKPEDIIKLVGEEGLKKLREYDVSRIKDPAAHLKTPVEQGELQPKRDPEVKRMTTEQWRKYNRS